MTPTPERLDELITWQTAEAQEARTHRNDYCVRQCDGVLAALRAYRELLQVYQGRRQETNNATAVAGEG